MPRSANAQLAVDMYNDLLHLHGWTSADAWQGIARLLLHCEIWDRGVWHPFHDSVVYRERSSFKIGPHGPNAVISRAASLTEYLAQELGVPRKDLCSEVAAYWRHPAVQGLQPHNLVGHAFRSLVVHILETFGDPGITYDEEVSPNKILPAHRFVTRSNSPKIDIIAWRGNDVVALISSRWRYRHDRVEVVEEAMAYAPLFRRLYPDCRFYASLGEFAPNRLQKVLDHCQSAQQPHRTLTAAVHYAPALITNGLGENGRMAQLKSLDWLISETFQW